MRVLLLLVPASNHWMHTLDLTTADLAETVRVWWIRPGKRRVVQVVAWADATVLDVGVSWPTGVHPERHEGWGKLAGSVRVTWVDALARAVVLPGVPVPDLSPWLASPRRGKPRAELLHRPVRARDETPDRIRAAGLTFLARHRAVRHALVFDDNDMRVDPGGPLLFVFGRDSRRRLRAVVSLEEA